MGKAHDIEREIEELRLDTDRLLEELERRLKETIDIRAQAEHHPLVTTMLTLSLATGVGLLVYNAFFRHQHGIQLPMGKAWHRPRENMFKSLKEFGSQAFDAAKTVMETLSKD